MRKRVSRRILIALVIECLLVGISFAQRRRVDSTAGDFDYYVLNLSWAPEFCASNGRHVSSSECDPAHHLGFVVHGLWPENDNGSYPQNCGSSSPVPQSLVREMLPIMPDRGLIQHEWARHGTCSGLDANAYFEHIATAFRKLQIPPEYRQPANAIKAEPSNIEQRFAQANHAPAGAFRVVCSRSELDVEVCLTKDLRFRQCGDRLRDCDATQVTLPPVR
jgi:ribonuclease T2